MLTHGFIRTECLSCGSARLVAFSCKGRTLCPSCGAKRMAVQAAHLLERVLPHGPIRQWVLSMPFDLRFLLASQPKIITAVLRTFIHSIFSYYRNANSKLHCDAIAFIQRFDSALNLNVHFHVVVLDGGYLINGHGDPVFQPATAPSHEAILNASTHIATATRRLLIRKGFIDHSGKWSSVLDAPAIPSFEPPKFGWFTAEEKPILALRRTTSKNKSTASVRLFCARRLAHPSPRPRAP